jgi:hemerythrin-like metal-binding protein
MVFIWDRYFETGIDIVDRQHRGLVDLINEAAPLLVSHPGGGGAAAQALADRLFDYAATHFKTEAALMKSRGLDAQYRAEHDRIHAAFVDDIVTLRAQLGTEGNAEAGPTLLRFLTGWLTFHILDEDQRMARQIRLIDGGATPADALAQSQPNGADDRARKALVSAMLDLYGVVGERNRALEESNEKLRQAGRQLAETNQLLEQRVEARTAELSEALHRMERTQSQLLQSEKMAAIGQLAAGVAHEINNPIGFVNSNIGTLRKYVAQLVDAIGALTPLLDAVDRDHPARQRAAEALRRADIDFLRADIADLIDESAHGLERVKKIVQDLKDFSHVDQSEWHDAEINECLEATLNVARNEIKYKASVEKQFGDLPLVRCVASEINQVFMNVLVNAAQAIDGMGVIRIATGTAGDRVWIEIEDNGKGIPPDVLGRIFEPFFTTKPVGKGTGLGLSISWDIVVKKHGGSITVRSQPGVGTCFRIELPLLPPAAAAGEGAQATSLARVEDRIGR